MSKQIYTMKEIAKALGTDVSNARKYAIRKGFSFQQIRTPESRNQITLCLDKQSFDKLISIREIEGYTNKKPIIKPTNNGIGWFYIIQLLPDELPNRVKLGYASSMDGRLQSHKTTCPNLKVLFQHKIREVWELAIIDMLSCVANKKHSQEIFDVKNVNAFIDYAREIFKKFPEL